MDRYAKRWTNDDIMYLIDSYRLNKDLLSIAQELKRSENAVKLKLESVIKEINTKYKDEYNDFIRNQLNLYIEKIYSKYAKDTKYVLPDTNSLIINEISLILKDLVDIIENQATDEYGLNEKQLIGYKAIKNGDNIFLTGEAGCHIYDTEILMYDGSVKMVQDIKEDELVMGDDSTPRRVLETVKGFDQMYKITHKENNESYIVNKDHILTLVYKHKKHIQRNETCFVIYYFDDQSYSVKELIFYYDEDNYHTVCKTAIEHFNNINENRIIDISITDYLKLNSFIKNNLFGIKTHVEFSYRQLALDPYIAGSMFGFNTIVDNNTNIDMYIINTIDIRLQFLSGVMDLYGYIYKEKCYMRFNEINNGIEQILFLLTSLNIKYKIKDNAVIISKNIRSRKYQTINNHKYKLCKINVEEYRPSMYYGFRLDNNHRYLMANMIVTHNCGKTHLVKKAIKYLIQKNKKIGITGSTGVSASLIGGTTLHSFLKIGFGKKTVEEMFEKIKNKDKSTFSKIEKLEVLIIDEISMIDNILFCKVAKLISLIQKVNKPFGRLQLILCGDFGQIKPVTNTYCFEASIWSKLNLKPIVLTDQIRQDGDDEFKSILSRLRVGDIDDEIYNKLKSLKKNTFTGPVKPTILYSLNKDIDEINEREYKKQLAKVGQEFVFKHKYNDMIPKIKKYVEGLPIKEVKLCIGLQIMVTYNISVESKLVNGTRGVIIDIFDGIVTIETVNGDLYDVDYVRYTDELDETITYEFMPLKLAYAISFHKAQGSTIDLLEIDLGPTVFDYGMLYVSLSRGVSLKNIRLLDLSRNSLKTHPKVIEFYKNLE